MFGIVKCPVYGSPLQLNVHTNLLRQKRFSNLLELSSVKKRDDELTQRIFASRLIGIWDHGVVSLVVVAQLQVVREQDVAEGGLQIETRTISRMHQN